MMKCALISLTECFRIMYLIVLRKTIDTVIFHNFYKEERGRSTWKGAITTPNFTEACHGDKTGEKVWLLKQKYGGAVFCLSQAKSHKLGFWRIFDRVRETCSRSFHKIAWGFWWSHGGGFTEIFLQLSRWQLHLARSPPIIILCGTPTCTVALSATSHLKVCIPGHLTTRQRIPIRKPHHANKSRQNPNGFACKSHQNLGEIW